MSHTTTRSSANDPDTAVVPEPASIGAAIYVRISKDREGAGLGVDRQRDDCCRLAERLGLGPIPRDRIYVDNDISAYSGKRRPAYRKLLRDIRDGTITAVLCWHTDRLHRSTKELEEYIEACDPRNVPTHCAQGGDLDLTTASGRMNARITGAVARHDSEHAAERIRFQKATAAAQGRYIGGIAFGYERAQRNEHGNITNRERIGRAVVPHEAEKIVDAAHRVIAGESLSSLVREWRETVPNPRGGSWTMGSIRRILTSPRYAGLVEHRGEVVGHAEWPALISVDDHKALRAIFSAPGRRQQPRAQRWLGSRIYACGKCGAGMRPTTRGNGVSIYTCSQRAHLSMLAEPVDVHVTDKIMRKLEQRGPDLLARDNADEARALHDKRNALAGRLDDLMDMFSDGELDRREYQRGRERVQAQLDDVTRQIDGMRGDTALDGIADATNPAAAFTRAPIDRRRAILRALFEVTILPSTKHGPISTDDLLTRVRVVDRES